MTAKLLLLNRRALERLATLKVPKNNTPNSILIAHSYVLHDLRRYPAPFSPPGGLGGYGDHAREVSFYLRALQGVFGGSIIDFHEKLV
jgi:hypothetical protein